MNKTLRTVLSIVVIVPTLSFSTTMLADDNSNPMADLGGQINNAASNVQTEYGTIQQNSAQALGTTPSNLGKSQYQGFYPLNQLIDGNNMQSWNTPSTPSGGTAGTPPSTVPSSSFSSTPGAIGASAPQTTPVVEPAAPETTTSTATPPSTSEGITGLPSNGDNNNNNAPKLRF